MNVAKVTVVGLPIGGNVPRAMLRREVHDEQEFQCASCRGMLIARNGDLKFVGYTRFTESADWADYVVTCNHCKTELVFETQTALPGATIWKMIWCSVCKHYFQIREDDWELANLIQKAKERRPWWSRFLPMAFTKPSAILITDCTFCSTPAEFDLLNNPHSPYFKRLVVEE